VPVISPGLQSTLRKITRALWAALFFTLPVTSFPYFPAGLGGKTLVRPLAMYPLLVLLLLVTLPRFFKRPLPKTILPLLAFIVFSLLSSVIAFSSEAEGLFGISLLSRVLRNLITLGLGVAFYLTVFLLIENWRDLEFSLRWLYAGFSLALLWGSAQALYILHFSKRYFLLLNEIQGYISTRKLFATRISGLTYEPKWFAEQICFLLLPWLFASIITKKSVFAWRYKWITVELVLAIWAMGVLVFTFSRTGLFILLGLVIISFLFARSLAHKTRNPAEKMQPQARRRILLETTLLVATIITIFVVVGAQNPYFSRLWRYFTEAKSRNRTYLEYIAFQQRFVYLETAFLMFEDQPLFGVGLGNYAFHFKDALPDEFYRLPEIVRQITPAEDRDRLITPKNMIARLLAETGIFGVATFVAFILAIWGCVFLIFFRLAKDHLFYGIGGILTMSVFSVIVFSFDSFAIPNMWVAFGLITAAAHLQPEPSNLPVSE